MKKLWLDVETTGLDPKVNEVVELAVMIEIDDVIVYKNFWELRPRNLDYISLEALRIMGKTEQELLEYPDRQLGTYEFVTAMRKYKKPKEIYTFCGFNCPFDIEFIKRLLTLCYIDYKEFFSHNTVDVLAFVRYLRSVYHIEAYNNKLGSLCSHWGIETDKLHNALSDIEATYKLYLYLNEKFIK